MAPFTRLLVQKRCARKRRPLRNMGKQDQPSLIIPLRLFPPQEKKREKKKKEEEAKPCACFIFPSQSQKCTDSPLPCAFTRPGLVLSYFSIANLRASSHLKGSTKCKERDVGGGEEKRGDGGGGGVVSARAASAPAVPPRSRRLFNSIPPPPSNATSSGGCASFTSTPPLLSHVLAASSMTRPHQCARVRAPRAARAQQPARGAVPLRV